LCKSCAGRRRNFFIKKNQKQKQKPRQIVATQKRKKMKKGVVAAVVQQKFRSQQSTKNKNCDKITEKQTREKSARKLYTVPERAQKAKGEIHTKFKGEKKDPQINE
jgi:hypothetical protein